MCLLGAIRGWECDYKSQNMDFPYLVLGFGIKIKVDNEIKSRSIPKNSLTTGVNIRWLGIGGKILKTFISL